MENNKNLVKLSIGLPVFNGEEFILKRIKNILEQNFNDYELIISDNASEDNTQKICNEIEKTDNRIQYFKQEKNMGPLLNFGFVLSQSKGKYFVWAGVDDYWEKDFLKECINFLEKNNEFVGSIGLVEKTGYQDRYISDKKIIKKIINSFRWSKYGPHEAVGTYEERIKIYLKAASAQSIYGCFRANELKKSFISDKDFIGSDLAIILNILKFGNFHVINKKLIKFYGGGYSKEGLVKATRKYKHSLIGRIFPHYPLTKWCFNNIGKKNFLKNSQYFLKLNLSSILGIIYDVLLKKLKP